MNRSEAEGMAVSLLIKHAPDAWRSGWRFGGFDRAAKRLGVTRFGSRTFHLSGVFVDHNDRESVEQTILHEIGHIIAGASAKHGPAWRIAARNIGYKGERTAAANLPETAMKILWTGECGKGCTLKYSRKPGNRGIYGVCTRHGNRITWMNNRTGEVISPTAAPVVKARPRPKYETPEDRLRRLLAY